MICSETRWFRSTRTLVLACLLAIVFVAITTTSAFSQGSGTWTTTGSLNMARFGHTATLLQNGQVLVVGGNANGNTQTLTLASAELYNPATGHWTVTGSMATPRLGHTATLLQNGQVLVAGGFNFGTGNVASSAELYDPDTGTWSVTGSMTQARDNHAAILLQNGLVLAAGGTRSSGVTATAELYNPSAGTWEATGSLNVSRYGAAAVLLPSGEVLVAGGANSPGGRYTPLASTELYNPSQGQWASAQSLNFASAYATATLLGNSDVLVLGAPGEFSDPSVHTWTNTGSYPRGALVDRGHAETLLGTGKVLVTGTRCNYSGCSHVATATCVLYDFSGNSWSITGSMNHARVAHTATRLANGQVLVVGGESGIYPTALASAELYTP